MNRLSGFYSSVRRGHGTSSTTGIGLVELLVAMAVAGVVFAVAGNIMVSHMLSIRQVERGQRFREDANRFNYLLAVEAGEASELIYNSTVQGCTGAGSALVELVVPRPTGVYADSSNVSRIYYYNQDGDIRRCGPPSNRNGVLAHGLANVPGVVLRRAVLEVSGAGGLCDQVSDDHVFVYSLLFADAAGGEYSTCQVARTKTVFVCNPPVGSGGDIGDCPS